MTLDFSRCRLPPFDHQREDTLTLLQRPYFFIASQMRTGKTKIVIDAAQFLFEMDLIDHVLIICPAPVRSVWFDRDLGEIQKHLWVSPSMVMEFHSSTRRWFYTNGQISREPPYGPKALVRRLEWLVTNFEFIRSKPRIQQVLPFCNRRTLMVIDESSFVRNHKAAQTQACVQLRRHCGRVVLLNGTPLYHSPLDLFSQGNLLHPSILDCPFITHFKARYAVQVPVLSRRLDKDGKATPKLDRWGRPILTIPRGADGWTNLDDLQQRFTPHTVRRLQADCLDLPPKLDPVYLSATLTEETWRIYRDMRDELIVWLKDGDVAVSSTAAIKIMRLSQITSGLLGGIEAPLVESTLFDQMELLNSLHLEDEGPPLPVPPCPSCVSEYGQPDPACPYCGGSGRCPSAQDPIVTPAPSPSIREIGREKLDVLLWFIEKRLEEDPNLHLVAWCKFRLELFRMLDAVRERFPHLIVGSIHGGQGRVERREALALLKPETTPEGPVFVGGIQGSGSFGLDMCAAHTCVTVSTGYSPGLSAQTLDRIYGPAQTHPISYYDIIAVGPKGQRTVDHQIMKALKEGQDIATWTSAAWIKALKDEQD